MFLAAARQRILFCSVFILIFSHSPVSCLWWRDCRPITAFYIQITSSLQITSSYKHWWHHNDFTPFHNRPVALHWVMRLSVYVIYMCVCGWVCKWGSALVFIISHPWLISIEANCSFKEWSGLKRPFHHTVRFYFNIVCLSPRLLHGGLHECSSPWWWRTKCWTSRFHWATRFPWCTTWSMAMHHSRWVHNVIDPI